MAVAQVRLLERRTSSRPGTPTSSASTDTPTPSEPNEDEDLLDEDEAPGSEPESAPPRLKRPFQLLIAAAMERNPTQFQLPNELTCTTALPGSSKRKRREEMTGKNVKRPQHELDHNGLVPLPVKVCFTCGRSCRVAPLIQCDYCPLLFHMDCLDPPLTAMPTGKWMCPNHMEHVVLSQKNMTLSNRCQLFDHFQDRISQHAVKVDFLRRVHRQNPPNRRGAHPHRKRTLKVPEAIKAQYKCPPQMLAPAGIRDGELICTGVPETPQTPPTDTPHAASETEQQEWLRDVITLQCSIMRHLSCRRGVASHWESEPPEKADVKPCVAPAAPPAVCSTHTDPQGAPEERAGCGSCAGRHCQGCRTANGPTEETARANGPLPRGPSPESAKPSPAAQHRATAPSGPARPCSPGSVPGPPVNHVGGAAIKTENSSACGQKGPASPSPAPAQNACAVVSDPGPPPQGSAGGQAAALTSRSVSSPPAATRALTPPRAPQDAAAARLASPTPPSDGKASPHAVSPATGGLFSGVKGVAEGDGELELSNLDERLIKLLAWQRIQQLLPPKARPTQTACLTPPQTASTTAASPAPSPPLSEVQKSEVQARAVFYPLTGRGRVVNMCYRTLYIGTGADMDVCLTNYGHCNFVSGKHACIFYDENTKHYELLNYSEHGTTVDNVLYSCDFSEKSSPGPAGGVVSKVQSIIRRCKRRKREEDGEEEEVGAEAGLGPGAGGGGVMSHRSQGGARAACGCKASSSSLIGGSGAGWEGTALLHHGSCVKLGCLQFVFSVAEFARKQPKEEAAPPAPTALGHQGATEPDDKQTLKLYEVPALCSSSVP
ncbi:PHD finger protein 12-like [Anguilla rostrata]|uniref:PHD finger protein 12-like n=1 Tax=Anguilla rostrata TaxID=7938 RepID=UPI0030D04D7B